ncbi:hypothetical protein [Aurantiacibacter gangjinensis]|uniref:Uncharacterized protein n=1 Tax=Aurantiacibacter gangjinensis TaxID=502682 RepID=A0A0G9MKZ1_9SPHN|nr:hypothetical protein [Aurantiacibacter gangjinensis]APE27229.1 hypothetical protein BMF35_a0400 [Aurantiacibacter gangjinensis]KLE31352.1 hypothetical protein AAW01_07010 [Aurantiacibacter gangjinensis]
MKIIATLFLSALIFLAVPARATPEDIITLRDEVFAIGPDSVFVLRTSRDNMGSYYNLQIESHLVRIDLESGDETSWLVYRALRQTVFDEDPALERHETVTQSVGYWHDPFAVIADAGATFHAGSSDAGMRLPQPETGEAEPDRFTIRYDRDVIFAFSQMQARARARSAVDVFGQSLFDAPRMSTASTRELFLEMFAGMMSEWGVCDFATDGLPEGMGDRRIQLVRMQCGDEDVDNSLSLIQLARPTGADSENRR